MILGRDIRLLTSRALKHANLYDNFKCIETIFDCLQINSEYNKTTSYKKDLVDIHDYRYLVNARKEKIYSFNEYTQVFSNKHGFQTNLSILDLLFNEGPNTLTYLESQTI